jgi:hypothetical protein
MRYENGNLDERLAEAFRVVTGPNEEAFQDALSLYRVTHGLPVTTTFLDLSPEAQSQVAMDAATRVRAHMS